MQKTTFNVPEISCAHCENSIKATVGALTGVQEVAVNLTEKTVTVEYSEAVTTDAVKAAIEDAGYDVA